MYIYIYINTYQSIYQFIYNVIWFEPILLQHMVVQSISDTLLEDHENEKSKWRPMTLVSTGWGPRSLLRSVDI